MTEKGEITEINSNIATVVFDRKSACDKCGMCLMTDDQKKVSVKVKNKLDAKVGDFVIVSMADRFVLRASLIVYFIPILMVGLSFIFTSKTKEIYQIIGLVIGLVLGVTISYIADKKLKNHKGLEPVMIKILEKSQEDSL